MRVALGLGSNLGERYEHLVYAVHALAALPRLSGLKLASIYETEAVDCADPLPFLNTAAILETDESPQDLLLALQRIEHLRGRMRSYTNAPRPLDLDILLADGLMLESSSLTVPHPRMAERPFVLVPLAEIAADWVHPRLERTVAQLCQQLPQPAPVMSKYRLPWPAGLFG